MARAHKVHKTNAMRELERKGIAFRCETYEDDGEHARGLGVAISEQLGSDPAQGFKTLVCESGEGSYVVCCVPAAEELDFKAAARAAGTKTLSMLATKRLTEVTGYVRGGCSPVGMKKRFPVVIDETCQLYDEIFISGGTCGIRLALAPDDLIACTGAIVAPITRER